MSPFGVIPRAIVAAVIIATMPVAAVAQQTLKIFDAHLHYSRFAPISQVLVRTRGYCQWRQKPLENKRFLLTALDTV
jgi:hypothetical protein